MPEPTHEHVVQTHKLTKVFRDFWHRPKARALNQLTLQVRRGEVFGLLGPNGAGKSTCIKLLLGLLFPTSGAIRIFGRLPRDVRVKARLGFLPEETYLYPYLNARETLEFFGRLNRLPRRERRRRVDALIDMVGLSPARNRPLREYSKGMARRLGLAQALLNDPELLLLDEPTTGLDPIGTREVKDLIAQLKERGKTILLCSHLLADVQDVCDRIGILYGGRLCTEGSVTDLLAQQHFTQFTVPDLTAEQSRDVRKLIREATGDRAVKVGHPHDRLETFFLKVVSDARKQRPDTAGATAGAFDPSLFRQAPGPAAADVISRLTAPTETREAPKEPVHAPAEPRADQQLLERLAVGRGAAEAPKPDAEKEREAEEKAKAETDAAQRSSVLGRLVQPGDSGSDLD